MVMFIKFDFFDVVLKDMLDVVFYVKFFGMDVKIMGDELMIILFFNDYFIGNLVLFVIYGGVMGVFFEMIVII